MQTEIPSDLISTRVVSVAEAAAIAGISLATLKRRCDSGAGPRITRLSPRRVGVRVDHLRQWLDLLAGDEPPRAA